MDELIGKPGNPGNFQIIVFILLCLNYCPLVFNHVIMAFFGARLTYTCNAVGNVSHYARRDESLTIIGMKNEKCVYKLYLEDGTNLTLKCQSGQWVYATENRETTTGTEWDLVCDDASLAIDAATICFCWVMLEGWCLVSCQTSLGDAPWCWSHCMSLWPEGSGSFSCPHTRGSSFSDLSRECFYRFKRKHAVISYAMLGAVTCCVAGALPPDTLASKIPLKEDAINVLDLNRHEPDNAINQIQSL